VPHVESSKGSRVSSCASPFPRVVSIDKIRGGNVYNSNKKPIEIEKTGISKTDL